jgi:hypothetical protein
VFRPENIMASSFVSNADLKAVLRASSMVPFYSTPWPVCLCRGRLAVDGFFTQPADRFGCPELPSSVARTVTVSVQIRPPRTCGAATCEAAGHVPHASGLLLEC